ncbi:FxsA family protein [Vreelandella populi]|uniref:FxsA family protein n=1 Tax=Vreelandella populi TaxID=2498858 RepID=A0A433LAV9_9GAMM|nr:FxsA family protein [Halomonas populi]RUR36583.1 FxsA family protein [Halomonas populi]RUR45045.1 FxsA family protein [Halomonas populi]RUR51383.1 FxsA family protein [Halomonas populi]
MPILIFISLFTLLDFILLFSIGSQIGLLTTLLLVLATGVIGLHLIRKEGVSTFARARQRMKEGEIPSQELLTGAALIFGGALLMAPGFLSDLLGIACLLPSARQLLYKALIWLGLKTGANAQPGMHENTRYQQGTRYQQSNKAKPGSHTDDGAIEGDFISRDETPRRH